jgi:hypothetical protein
MSKHHYCCCAIVFVIVCAKKLTMNVIHEKIFKIIIYNSREDIKEFVRWHIIAAADGAEKKLFICT